jgi:hypothetical protein
MGDRVLPGLLQRALSDANQLSKRVKVDDRGDIWRVGPAGWVKVGMLARTMDREDFLVAQLSQEDR